MNPSTLIESRHSLWMERLRELTAKANAGETHVGIVDIETAQAEAVAVICELEHLADTFGIELDETLYGGEKP